MANDDPKQPSWWRAVDPIGQWAACVNADQIYRYLIQYYLHQDQLSWGRIQNVVVVELALLAASYHCAGKLVGVAVLVVGTPIILLLWQLIKRDWEIRDQNLKRILDKVHGPLGIVMCVEPRNEWWRGSTIVKRVVWGLVFLNVLLAILYLWLAFGSPNVIATLNLLLGLNK